MNDIDSLKSGAADLLKQFSQRVDGMKGKPEYSMLIRRLDKTEAVRQAVEYFGQGEYQAIGVDGSMDQAETLEMLLFYVNAVAYSAPFVVTSDSVIFRSDRMKKEDAMGASSAVPLWLEDLGLVADPTREIESETDFAASLTQVSFSLMLLAELACAHKALEKESTRLLFLDRPISGTFQSLSRDVRYLLKSGTSALEGMAGSTEPALMGDLYLFNAVPFRNMPSPGHGSGKIHRIIDSMLEGNSFRTACTLTGLETSSQNAVRMNLSKRGKQFSILEEDGSGDLLLRKGSNQYRERLSSLGRSLVERVFSGKSHPLRVGKKWLTTRDINALNQVLLVDLIEKAEASKALLVGITKDTGSTDVGRSVIGLMGLPPNLSPGLRHDRVMFTILSATNETAFTPPWRSVGYDACFATLSPNEETVNGKKPPLRASRKFASREQLFVKFFFQTRASEKTIFRSPVFMYDRSYVASKDSSWGTEMDYVERGKVQTINPYLEKQSKNPFDDMILYLLSLSDNPEVFESYGHNILLYMADKAAKADIKLKHGLLLGVINLELTPLARREKLFSVIRRYRDARSEMEQSRVGSGGDME